MVQRFELTDEQWERLQPLLPPKAQTGRPATDHRQIINGILWILRTGAPWRDLPERYGPWGWPLKLRVLGTDGIHDRSTMRSEEGSDLGL